jgi:hypothetical protein
MITLDKPSIFARFKGDADMFGRAGRAREKELISDGEWYLIDTLFQDATVIDRNIGSERRILQAKQRILENCEDDQVVAKIHLLAEKL